MNLQKHMINSIEKYGGLQKVINDLEKSTVFLYGKEKQYIQRTVVYFRMVYTQKMNVEKDIIENFDLTTDFLTSVEHLYTKHSWPIFKLLIEITTYNLKSLANLRKLRHLFNS